MSKVDASDLMEELSKDPQYQAMRETKDRELKAFNEILVADEAELLRESRSDWPLSLGAVTQTGRKTIRRRAGVGQLQPLDV